MEKKIVFLTSNVRFGNHKRYQDWFQRQYLATVESQSLRCDLIRFIVGVIHPTNELLCSDIIPRWAVIGWLLTTCTSAAAAANAKLALFYDWLFFEPEKDNIMNIEPAILVMFHSIRSHASVTATLLDFLCRIIPNFSPALTDKVQVGIFSSLRQILDKRVLPSLSPIFDNPKLDRDLRQRVRETFKEFCQNDGKLDDSSHGKEDASLMEGHMLHDINSLEKEPVFSEDDDTEEDDIPLGERRARKTRHVKTRTTKVRLKEKREKDIDIASLLCGEMRVAVESMDTEDKEAQCEAMERLVQLVSQDDLDSEGDLTLATCLCAVLKEQLDSKLFPDEVTEESLEDSMGRPLFVIFRDLMEMDEDDPKRRPVLRIVAEMTKQEPKIGYLLLYFLKACKMETGKAILYRQFCKALDVEVEASLLNDLKLCQEDDVPMFCWVVPEVYTLFPSIAVGHKEMLHLLLETVDAIQMQALICLVLQGQLVIFDKDTFLSVLEESLDWETFEQCCLWHLIEAHSIPIDYIMPILPKLDFGRHAEALSSIMLFLKQERPTVDLLKNLLCRDMKFHDHFVVSLLKYWIQDYEEKVAEMFAGLLSKHSNSPNKRKRGSAGANVKPIGPPSMEHILAHLDQLRNFSRHSPHFFLLDSMQRALQQVQATCSDSLKKKFTDLLALAEDLTPRGSGTGGRGTRKVASSAKAARGRPVKEIISDSSDDSSEEEEIIKPKQAKKRKKTNPVNSDSD